MLYRLLQGDLRKMTEEDKSEPLAAPRKAWDNIPFQPRILPLEVTASAMEGRNPVPANQSWDLTHCVIVGPMSLTFLTEKNEKLNIVVDVTVLRSVLDFSYESNIAGLERKL